MSSTTVALLLVAAALGSAAPLRAEPARDTALLIIDIQNFYFPGGRLPLVDPADASRNARRLLDSFRAQGWPVIHVQHMPPSQTEPDPTGGDVQYRIHADVVPAPGETIIVKHYANAFRDTDLLKILRSKGITKLVICGMQTHMCVEAATRAAADLGFDVTVVGDACATRDLSYGGVTVPARQVHAATLAALQGTYAQITTTDAWLAGHRAPAGGER